MRAWNVEVAGPALDVKVVSRPENSVFETSADALRPGPFRQTDTGTYAVLAVRKAELTVALTEAVHRTILNRVNYFRVPLPQPFPNWLQPVQAYLAPDGLVPGFAFVQVDSAEVTSRLVANGGTVTIRATGKIGYALVDEHIQAAADFGDAPSLPLTGSAVATVELTLPITVDRQVSIVSVGNPLANTGLLKPGFPVSFSRLVASDKVSVEVTDDAGATILPSVELVGNAIAIVEAGAPCPDNTYCIGPDALVDIKSNFTKLVGDALQSVTQSFDGKRLITTLFGAGFDRAYVDDSTNEWQVFAFRSDEPDAGRRGAELSRPGELFTFHMSPSALIATTEFNLGTGEIQTAPMYCDAVRSLDGELLRYEMCSFLPDGDAGGLQVFPFSVVSRELVGRSGLYPIEIVDSPFPLDDFELHGPVVGWAVDGSGIRIDFRLTGAVEFDATLSFIAEPAFTPDGRLDFRLRVDEFDIHGVWDNEIVQAGARALIATLGLGALAASFVGFDVSSSTGTTLLDFAFSDWEQYIASEVDSALAGALPPKAIALPSLDGDVVEMIRGEFIRLEFGDEHGVTLVVGLDLASRTVSTQSDQLVVARGDGILVPLVVETPSGAITVRQDVTAPLRRGEPRFNGTNLLGEFDAYVPVPNSQLEPHMPMWQLLSVSEARVRADFESMEPAPIENGFLELIPPPSPREGEQYYQVLFLRNPAGDFSVLCVGGVRQGEDLPRPRAETEIAVRAAVAGESFDRWMNDMWFRTVGWLIGVADPLGADFPFLPPAHSQTLRWWRRATRAVWTNSTADGPKADYLFPDAYADVVRQRWQNENPDGEGRQRSIHEDNLEMMLEVASDVFGDTPLNFLDPPLSGFFDSMLRSVASGRLSGSVGEYFDEDWDALNAELPPGYWELPRPEFVLRGLQPPNQGLLRVRVTAVPAVAQVFVAESHVVGGQVWSTHTESRILSYDVTVSITVGGVVDPGTTVAYTITTQRFGEAPVVVANDEVSAMSRFLNPTDSSGEPVTKFTRYRLIPFQRRVDFSSVIDRGDRDICVEATLQDAWGNKISSVDCIKVDTYLVEDKLTSAAQHALSDAVEVAALDISLGSGDGESDEGLPFPGNPSVDPPDGESGRAPRFKDPLARLRARIRADLESRAKRFGTPLPPVPRS